MMIEFHIDVTEDTGMRAGYSTGVPMDGLQVITALSAGLWAIMDAIGCKCEMPTSDVWDALQWVTDTSYDDLEDLLKKAEIIDEERKDNE